MIAGVLDHIRKRYRSRCRRLAAGSGMEEGKVVSEHVYSTVLYDIYRQGKHVSGEG